MKPYAESFYKSKAWEKTRKAYAKSVGNLCEMCGAKGIVKAGDIVHHKTHISPDNISEPNITLSWDNLMLVCRDCHAQLHEQSKKRYIINEDGSVTVKQEAV